MIKIKCPVKMFNRTKIQWVKDQNYLPKSKKYKVSKKGALRILNLSYRDSGIYICIAGRSTADLVLSVKPRPGEFPTSEEIQKQAGYKTDHRIDFEIADIQAGRDELNPVFGNDDHSHEQRPDMPRKTPTPRTRIILPTFPPYRGGNVNLNSLSALPPQSTTLVFDDDQYLWPFQTFSNSRGHRMVATFSDNQLLEDTTSQTETTEEDEYGSMVILGKGSPGHVQFEWMTTEWSKCSQICGGNGFQMRSAHCMVRLHNTTQDVESNFCEDAGLMTPETIIKCGMEECPKWSVSEWTPCEKSKCFTWNTAIQRRAVICQNSENITIDASKCDDNDKPPHRQECYRDQCKGMWKVGPWSKCAAVCDMQGVKYRILQCVWYGTERPAGTACRDLPRPPVMKSCKGPSCSTTDSECNDHSKFCENVKAMNLCKIVKYQHQCCHTCQISDIPIK